MKATCSASIAEEICVWILCAVCSGVDGVVTLIRRREVVDGVIPKVLNDVAI